MDKKHIINEIVRTAKENSNVPLGCNKFEKETGIKHSDWYGIYWARWGDAVKEAGYEPRKMQSAYDENYLIEQVILLIKEIKKFPADGDLRLKAHNTKGFPSHNSISRLGNKQELANRIFNYCKENPDYSEVAKICKEKICSSVQREKNNSKESSVEFGFVYLMKSGRYYKIGQSDYVEKRRYDLGTKLPEDINILHKIKTEDPTGIEAYWHKRFDEKRKKGEWFDLSNDDVKTFKRRKFM